MKILICDDEAHELSKISILLQKYMEEKKVGLTYTFLTSSLDLLEKIRLESFDVLFLDILMPKFDGMQAAHEIRSFDSRIRIVFLSNSPEYAVESYSVKAFAYLLKPINREHMFPVLDDLLFHHHQMEDCLTIKNKTGVVRILFSKLSYVEVMGKTLSFHMCDGVIHNTKAPLSKYQEELLDHTEFIRVHRAFLVNLWHMKEINERNFISSDNQIIPISRRLYHSVKEAYIKSLFTQKITVSETS